MALDNWTSLEDAATKTPEETGVFASIKNTWNKVTDLTDNISDMWADMIWWIVEKAPEMIADTFSAVKKVVTTNPLETFLPKNTLIWKQVEKQQYNDFELQQAEKLWNISSWQMATDIASSLWDFWKEKLKQDDLSKSLKIDKPTFESNISVFQNSISEIDNKLNSIDKSKYSNLFSFNENVYQNYLKEKKLSSIQDQADFELYKQKELQRLNWIEQQKILQETANYSIEASQLEMEKAQKEEEMRKYLNENINAEEWKSWEQIYNELQQKQNDSIKKKEYINTVWEIYNYSKQQVEDKFEALWLAKNSDYAWYDTFKESVVDDIAVENQYMMSIKWMKDLPWYEELADQVKEINTASFNFKMNFSKTYLDIRNNPENKWLTETEIRDKALKISWDSFPEKEKELYKNKEKIVTQIAAVKNFNQIKENPLNPKSIYDLVEFGTTKIQQIFDNAYDYETDDVPHYVKQDTRNMIYAWEWIWKNIATAITYNPDTLLSILVPSIWWKTLEAAADSIKTVAQSNKILKWPLKIWYWNATTRFIWKAVKNVSESQLYWAILDTVLDNVQMEAPSKMIEWFNMISNVLFDTTPFVLQWAKWWVTISMNRIAYEFLDNPTKESVQQFSKAFSQKLWTNIWIWEAKTILDEWVKKLYRTTYNPSEVVDIMNTPNKLYDFVSTQINWLKVDDAKKVLTDKWLAFEYNELDNELWFSKKDQFDIKSAFMKKWDQTIESQFEWVKFDNLIKLKEDSLQVWKWWEWWIMILSKKVKADEKTYNELVAKAKTELKILQAARTIDEFENQLDVANSAIRDVQSKFSNTKKEIYIKLKWVNEDFITEFRVWQLTELSDSTLPELFKAWKVKFTKWDFAWKEFNIVDERKLNLETKLKDFIFESKTLISEKELELWLNDLPWYEWSNTLEWSMKKILLWKTDTLQMPYIKDKEMFDSVAEFMNSRIKTFIWWEYMSSNPININKVLKWKINEVTWLAKWKDILEYMSSHDSYINLSYWSFIWKDWKEKHVIYLMPWEKLLNIWDSSKIFKAAFNWLKDWDIDARVLKNQWWKIINTIFNYSIKKDWKIDLSAWIAKAAAEYSAQNIEWLFDEKWLIESVIKKEVLWLLDSIYPNNKQAKEISEFIYEAVKWFDKNQEAIIKPIIYNLTYQYANNKKLIDAMITKWWKFEWAFADILLSKKLREQISKRIKLSMDEVPVKITEKVSEEMTKYFKRLEFRQQHIEDKIKMLEWYKKSLTLEEASYLQDEIDTLTNRLNAIKTQLRRKVSLEKMESDKFLTDNLYEFITSKSMQASSEILWTWYSFLKNNIDVWSTATQKDLLDLSKTTIKNIQNLSKKDADDLWKLVDKVIANIWDNKKIQEIRDWVTNTKVQKILDKIIKQSTESNVPVLLKEIHSIWIEDAIWWVLQYEDAIKNNPIKKWFKAFINNNNTWRDEILEEVIVKHYLWEAWWTINDVYRSEKFKAFTDEIYNVSWSTIKEAEKNAKQAKQRFNKEIKDIFTWYWVIARKDWEKVDISEELVNDMINDHKFFQNIKAVSNKTDLVKWSNYVWDIVKKVWDVYKKEKFTSEEIPLQFLSMKDKIKTGKEVRVKLLWGWNNDYIKSFIKINKKYSKLIDYFITYNNQKYLKNYLSRSPVEETIIFKQWFNRNDVTTFVVPDHKLIKKITNELWDDLLKMRNEWYAFVAWFWDKDSYMHLYKAPDEILKLVRNKNEASEIYHVVEYAYANWYTKLNREYKTHDEFLKSFTKYLDDKYDFTKWLMNSKQLYDDLEDFIWSKALSINEYLEDNFYWLSKETKNYIDKNFDRNDKYDLQFLIWKIFKDEKLSEDIKNNLIEVEKNLNIISLEDIKKRESFNTSVRKTFWDVKIPLNMYVIDELKMDVPKFYDKYLKINLNKLSQEDITKLIDDLSDLPDENLWLKETVAYLKTVSSDDKDLLWQLQTTLKTWFYNDNQDWTSFISKDILELRWIINWLNLNNKEVKNAYNQFKDHFYWEIWETWTRFWVKTLFNNSEIKDSLWNIIDSSVAMWISSVKLWKDFIDKTKQETIIINWRAYKAWKVEWADTSFFKNAGSDSFDFSALATFGSSIISSFSEKNISKIWELQKVRIKEAFDRHLGWLFEIDYKTWAMSSVDIALLKNLSSTWMWYSSSSFISNKLDAFMREVDEIINKPQEAWQSMFIYESNGNLIKPNEIIMHPESETVKVIRKDVAMSKYSKEYSELTEEEKLFVDDNLFTVWYRYPVPSTYNMWTYKIKLNTDKSILENWINPYKDMWTEQVVLHPLATYLKLEWDNDWDHVFFISAFSDFWKICTNELHELSSEWDYINTINQAFKNWKMFNDFIALKQVEKWAALWSQTLAESRLSALWAKSYVGNVSATIRTIKNLNYSKLIWDIEIPINLWNDESSDILYNYEKINSIDELESLWLDKRKFASIANQLLQDALDFGKSWKAIFDPNWYKELLLAAWIKEENLDYVQALLITPSSVSYSPDMKWYNIPQIFKDLDSKNKNNTKFLFNITWVKRNLIEYIWWLKLKNMDLTLSALFTAFNKPYDFKYLLNKFNDWLSKIDDETYASRLKEIYNSHYKMKDWSERDFITWTEEFRVFDSFYKVPTQEQLLDIWERVFEASEMWYDYWLLHKWKYFAIWPFEKLAITMKWKKYVDDVLSYLNPKDKKDKELIWRTLFKNIKNLSEKDPVHAYNLWMLLFAWWEKKLLNILNQEDYINFLNESDLAFDNRVIKDNIRLKDLFKANGIKTPEKQVSEIVNLKDRYNESIKELQLEINKALQENRLDDLPVLQSALVSRTNDYEILDKKISELTIDKESEQKLIEQINAEPDIIEPVQEYLIPWYDEKMIYIDKDWVKYLVDETTWFVEKTRNWLNGKIIKYFEEYVPELTYMHALLNDKLWINNDAINKAFEFHTLHFNEKRRYEEWIIQYLKNAEVPNYNDIARKIQYWLIDFTDWKYQAKEKELALKHIRNYLGTNWSLVDNEWFVKALMNYSEWAITRVAEVLNNIEAIWYNPSKHYVWWEAFSLIIDTLQAHKWDPQLALRLSWFKNREQFKSFVSARMWDKINKWALNTMIEVLYWWQSQAREKVFWTLQSIHYDMNYWKMSLITWNWLMSAIAQMLPNYVELRSYLRKNLTDISDWYKAMKRFWLLDSESTIILWTWIWKDFNEYGLLDWTIEWILKSMWQWWIKSNHAVALWHAILTNPLWWTDYSIETLRKMVAISNTMKKLKIKNVDELEQQFLLYWNEYEWMFRSKVRKAFAESWGWVNSSSSIYKDTVASRAYNYADFFWVRFATKSFGYLMWWSYNKTATLIEKEAALWFWLRDILKWNFKSGKAHIDDWFTYNSIIAHQAMLSLWLYMKMEKYEKNNEERVSFENFANTFMNSLVSINILLDKHLKAWESAEEAWWDFQDKLWYTTVWIIRNTFRLFGQTNFIATMYKHYIYNKEKWIPNIMDSLEFAMKQHYSSYIRYTWIEAMDNIYWTLWQQWNVAMLWTWASTDIEDMFKDLENQNYFRIYKEKWFIKAMADMFPSLITKNFTSTPASIQSLITKDLIKIAMEDKNLANLVRWWWFWKDKWQYNLESLFWKTWSNLTAEQYQWVSDIYRQLSDYTYNYLKTTWIKWDSPSQSTADRMLHELIDKALVKEWINIEDLIAKSTATPELMKTLAVLESKYAIKNPLVISLMIENEYNRITKELKETQWRVTWQVSAYWTAYKDLTEEDKMKVKRDLLVKYQEYFNLNRQIWMDIIAQDIQMNHWDKLEKYKNIFTWKYWEEMSKYLQKSFIIWQVAKSGDTSVSKLHSRYAIAAKWLWSDDTTVVIVNNFLHKLFQQEWMWNKEKLANAAWFLSWLDKATYWMLSNNEEFNKLTDNSKKILANWIYKINWDAIDYDSNSLMNELNWKAYWRWSTWKTPYFKVLHPKYKSSSFEWTRPNYSKQFTPIQNMLPNMVRYIDKDNNWYLKSINPYQSNEWVYNNIKTPYMKQYKDLLIEQLFYWYKSKWVIKTVYANEKIDKPYEKSINIKKSKTSKQKEKTFVKKKTYKKHTKNLFLNSPLATYGWE